jgi:hypothetical protein
MGAKNWVGETVGGRYKIEELLGQGGMSAVYKATDPNLRRVVAVKMIHAHLSDNPEFVRRFKEEAAAVAQLRHPNIVQVFDYNEQEDVYFMVLEFVPGETLQTRLRRLEETNRNLPLSEALKYAAQVCDAVEYAHQQGIVHRDIKPANVMLNVHGQAILTDFGIAKILGGQQHTATGAVIGTALYMSPEQIRGERLDERTDIYSIGVTLFEMVDGAPPFEADSAMTLMMMHLNDPVPDLRQLRPNVPDELVRIIEKSLAKDRNRRYQKASEMAAELRRVQKMLEGYGEGSAVASAQMGYVQPSASASWVAPAASPAAPAVPPTGTAPVAGTAAAPAYPPASDSALRTYPVSQSASQQVYPNTGTGDSAFAAAPAPAKGKVSPLLIAGGVIGGLVLICLVASVIFLMSQAIKSQRLQARALAVAQTSTAEVLLFTATPLPTNPLALTATPEPPTPMPSPTTAPTQFPTDTPQATDDPYAQGGNSGSEIVPGNPYVLILSIAVENGAYVVQYETLEFIESLSSTHIHFFFNTVKPEDAGVPGKGPWILYGGPRPFKSYKLTDRPAGATQICALVAHHDHTVIQNSGNCVDLPPNP